MNSNLLLITPPPSRVLVRLFALLLLLLCGGGVRRGLRRLMLSRLLLGLTLPRRIVGMSQRGQDLIESGRGLAVGRRAERAQLEARAGLDRREDRAGALELRALRRPELAGVH